MADAAEHPERGGVRDPVELTASATPTASAIPAATRMGAVQLSVADLDRSLAYYRDAIGLTLQRRDGDLAELGSGGEPLLRLREEPGGQAATGFSGLFHVALLLPERTDLAAWLAHAQRDGVALTGMSDHFVSEALYVRDPDGHGVEIYWDRPRAEWEGQVADRLTTQRLRTGELLHSLGARRDEPFTGLPAGTTVGHVHLCVDDLEAATVFYRDVLGFGVMAEVLVAAFLSAGGYHHHVAINVWESLGKPQAPAGHARMEAFEIVLPDESSLRATVDAAAAAGHAGEQVARGWALRDPAGNPLLLRADAT